MNSRLIMSEQPQLTEPYILIGMKGWLNAGEVSTGSVDYLRRKVGAQKFASIDAHGFYIYQVPSSNPELTMRPHTQISEGLVKNIEFPENNLFFWKSGTDHDLILILGAEPNLNWPEFCQAILDLARQFQSPRIYCLGGFFDQVPHTRDTRIHATVSHPRMRTEFSTFVDFTAYAGPCSFTTMLIYLGHEQGVEVAGTAARLPIYINDLNSRGCHDLLKKVLKMTGYQLDLSDLKQAGEKQLEMVNDAFNKNPTASAQLRRLEEIYDGAFEKDALPDSEEDFDRLLEEMRKLKREGRKPH
jgi:proteasome assembly chaperone (PAC2) family protein